MGGGAQGAKEKKKMENMEESEKPRREGRREQEGLERAGEGQGQGGPRLSHIVLGSIRLNKGTILTCVPAGRVLLPFGFWCRPLPLFCSPSSLPFPPLPAFIQTASKCPRVSDSSGVSTPSLEAQCPPLWPPPRRPFPPSYPHLSLRPRVHKPRGEGWVEAGRESAGSGAGASFCSPASPSEAGIYNRNQDLQEKENTCALKFLQWTFSFRKP